MEQPQHLVGAQALLEGDVGLEPRGGVHQQLHGGVAAHLLVQPVGAGRDVAAVGAQRVEERARAGDDPLGDQFVGDGLPGGALLDHDLDRAAALTLVVGREQVGAAEREPAGAHPGDQGQGHHHGHALAGPGAGGPGPARGAAAARGGGLAVGVWSAPGARGAAAAAPGPAGAVVVLVVGGGRAVLLGGVGVVGPGIGAAGPPAARRRGGAAVRIAAAGAAAPGRGLVGEVGPGLTGAASAGAAAEANPAWATKSG